MVEFGVSEENLISIEILVNGAWREIEMDVDLMQVMMRDNPVRFSRVLDDSEDIITVLLRPEDYFYTAIVEEVEDANEEKDSE